MDIVRISSSYLRLSSGYPRGIFALSGAILNISSRNLCISSGYARIILGYLPAALRQPSGFHRLSSTVLRLFSWFRRATLSIILGTSSSYIRLPSGYPQVIFAVLSTILGFFSWFSRVNLWSSSGYPQSMLGVSSNFLSYPWHFLELFVDTLRISSSYLRLPTCYLQAILGVSSAILSLFSWFARANL